MSKPTLYLSKPKVAMRYGKTARTIDNWVRTPSMNFPRPVLFRGRDHFAVDGEDGLDAWDAAQSGTAKPICPRPIAHDHKAAA